MGASVEYDTRRDYALPEGATIGGYAIRRMLGKGGFGITYEAHNRFTGKTAAIKEFFPTDIAWRDGDSHLSYAQADADTIDWALRKFEATTTTLCNLEHRNIVQVYDYVPFNDTGYMIMELLDGQTLQKWLEARPSPPGFDELRALLDPVMEALTFVHGKGLIHRDIAPDNILITQSGRPVLIDFGSVSRDLTQARAGSNAGTKGVWKRHYTAPEQILASARPTPQADIYSMGAVLYRALSGVEPVDGDARKHESFIGRADPYRPLMERLPAGMPGTAAEAIDKALALRPENRFYSITEFRSALERRVEPPPPPPPPPPTIRPPNGTGPHVVTPPGGTTSVAKWILGGAVLIVLALVGGVLGGKVISDMIANQQIHQTEAELRRERDAAAAARQQQDEADRRVNEARQERDAARQREAEATRQRDDARAAEATAAQQAEADRQAEAARQAERQAEAERQAQAAREAEAQHQAEAARQPSLQDLATAAVATFYNRHSYTPGDNLRPLAALYPANGQIDINGVSRTANEQVAALQQYYSSKGYTTFQIAPVTGSLSFECDVAENCIVRGQTLAAYQTQDNPTPRSSRANFCLRLDLRGGPKVLSEHSVSPGKRLTCG